MVGQREQLHAERDGCSWSDGDEVVYGDGGYADGWCYIDRQHGDEQCGDVLELYGDDEYGCPVVVVEDGACESACGRYSELQLGCDEQRWFCDEWDADVDGHVAERVDVRITDGGIFESGVYGEWSDDHVYRYADDRSRCERDVDLHGQCRCRCDGDVDQHGDLHCVGW